jgi:glycosyltransferase involved in cell wall biosynthesis
MTRPLRVLHCPEVVGGMPGELARAERALGADSRAVAFENTVYDYPIDEVLYTPDTGRLKREWKRWGLLRRALSFDVIHFNFGRTIMPDRTTELPGRGPIGIFLRRLYAGFFELRDVALLKRLGKAVFVTFQGDDLRQGDFCERHFGPAFVRELPAGYYSPETDARKHWRAAKLAKLVDGMYAVNPDLMYVLPPTAKFLRYGHLDPREWTYTLSPPPNDDGPLVIHAPTHRGVKGTRFVLEAVDKLKAEGVRFRFELIEGLPRAEARRLFERADLLVDQLWLGWYGGIAVELMALGRPVVSNIREDGLKFLPPEMAKDLPLIRAEPATLVAVLRDWLTTRRKELPRIGEQSRRFVERWHDPRDVAKGLLADYSAALTRSHTSKRSQLSHSESA